MTDKAPISPHNLVVFECSCGFHLGLDASYLGQVEDIEIKCPNCKECIDITFPEEGLPAKIKRTMLLDPWPTSVIDLRALAARRAVLTYAVNIRSLDPKEADRLTDWCEETAEEYVRLYKIDRANSRKGRKKHE